MNTARDMTEFVEAHASPPEGMMFFESLGSIQGETNLLGHVSAMERAWIEMDLAGVLCLDGRPILYLKTYPQPSSSPERIRLQRLFWNQGLANILVLADPTSVYIHSGLAKPPRISPDGESEGETLVDTLTYADYVHRIQSFYHDLATGHYYDKKQKHFKPDESVDAWLLDNLRALRKSLTDDGDALDIKSAHSFIGRVLFLCYLLDREIVSVGTPGRGRTGTMQLADILQGQPPDSSIDYLYKLFGSLRDQFNGNMFDQDLDAEKRIILQSHLQKLTLFLRGDEVQSGQRTMGFWPYDFKMIPVETISAVYQDFLGAEDPQGQEQSGAYYTPRFLAEMVVDVAIHDNPDALDWSFLDPACGSGIFLVILFNRLANRWVHTRTEPVDYHAKAKALQRILDRQICGIDKEETACRIACFSLYLAYLDFFDPPDIIGYVEKTGKPLPKLLDYGDTPDSPPVDIPVIHKRDSLAEGTLSGKTFDCVIGNPPWEGRQSKQLAQKFMQKALFFLRKGGTGCLLLPSKILQNQTDAFQAEWLGEVTLKRVLQLADYRRLLFQDAKCPAFITLFTNTPPQTARHMVEFIAPKFNRDGLRQGIITVNPTDRTWIPLADIFSATKSKTAPMVWKRRLWGTTRDQKFLDLLQSMPSLAEIAGKPNEKRRWMKGQGLQPYYTSKAAANPTYPKPKTNPWSLGTSYLLADQELGMFVLETDCTTFGEILNRRGASLRDLRRAPHGDLFKTPMVLVSQGFSKVAFSPFDVLFQDSLQSITGPEKDTDLLMFLAAYLRSNLAKYFLFHTSANWGTERDKVHLMELLRVPFPLPGNEFASPDASEIVSEIANKMKELRRDLKSVLSQDPQCTGQHSFGGRNTGGGRLRPKERKERVDALQEELEPLIYRYFGLTEQEIILVEDTVRVFIPSSTPTTRRSETTVTLEPVEQSRVKPYVGLGLAAYADTLTETLNDWAEMEGSAFRVSAEGGADEQTGLAMVTLSLSSAEVPYAPKPLSEHLTGILKELCAHASEASGSLHYRRDMVVFHGGCIYIVRPNILLNWTRTAALNDAARIYAEVALAGEEAQ